MGKKGSDARVAECQEDHCHYIWSTTTEELESDVPECPNCGSTDIEVN